MRIRLIEIKTSSEFELPALRKRAQDSSKSAKTIHYRAVDSGEEVAFVAIDRWPELNQMILYEIFIPLELRNKGFGSAVLTEVEKMAINEGIQQMRLRPKPLDQGISPVELAAWYVKRGYKWDSVIAGDMLKELLFQYSPE